MKKVAKCILKIVISVLAVILSLILIFIINSVFNGYNYESDIECINGEFSDNFEIKEIIYKYENDSKEILLYNSINGNDVETILHKRNDIESTKYKLWKYSIPGMSTYSKEWTKVDRNLRYIFVDFEEDIDEIDCEGFEPIGTRIYYTTSNGEVHICWIYVIDETKQESKN